MNIQTLPRKDKVVKRAFIPKLDYLVFGDYDQIEMRVLAYYMSQLGDSSMRDVLLDPDTDLHKESARGIFQIDREPTDAERQLGKNMNFSMVYGGGKPAVMRYLVQFNNEGGNIPVTWEYAGEVLDRFHRRWPGIRRVISALEATYNSRGYLKTVAGARLHPTSSHKMLNAVVQSSAAEVMRSGLRVCHRELAECRSHLVTVIHDELVFDVAAEEFDWLVQRIPQWMDYPKISEVVPITVSMEYTQTNWSEKKGLHD
jgi:DNA polymerase-1